MFLYALSQVITNAKNTISNVKRLIGRKFDDPYVQHEIPNLPYEVIKQQDGSVGIKVSTSRKETFMGGNFCRKKLLWEETSAEQIFFGSNFQIFG